MIQERETVCIVAVIPAQAGIQSKSTSPVADRQLINFLVLPHPRLLAANRGGAQENKKQKSCALRAQLSF